jgi:hypothetical protein
VNTSEQIDEYLWELVLQGMHGCLIHLLTSKIHEQSMSRRHANGKDNAKPHIFKPTGSTLRQQTTSSLKQAGCKKSITMMHMPANMETKTAPSVLT